MFVFFIFIQRSNTRYVNINVKSDLKPLFFAIDSGVLKGWVAILIKVSRSLFLPIPFTGLNFWRHAFNFISIHRQKCCVIINVSFCFINTLYF